MNLLVFSHPCEKTRTPRRLLSNTKFWNGESKVGFNAIEVAGALLQRADEWTFLLNSRGPAALGAEVGFGNVDGANRVDGNPEPLRDRSNRKLRRSEQFDDTFASVSLDPSSTPPESAVAEYLC